MVSEGEHVLLVAGGVSVFRVVEVDGDRAVVEPVEETPGGYRFPTPIAQLVPVTQE